MENIILDRHSRSILSLLQRDARMTVQQIAEQVGLSTTPVWKRIKTMEAAGVIRSYSAQVDPHFVGYGLRVVVEINIGNHNEKLVRQFEREVAAHPHIVQCYSTTGTADYVLTVLATDIKGYERFLHDILFRLPGVTHVRSSVVLKEVKQEVSVPVDL